MKQLLRVFALTVPEQRVIIVALLLYVLSVVCVLYPRAPRDPIPLTSGQPSPSPGILP
ncbi:MAG: hypothetical protein M3Y86_08245 [Verrucomicrobiota bacterium]|nr:hypothetical protein [Verrucomicrobiota bacterium]